jgi:photosystem II stability/assembly factor-like uncharacterized protein
MTLTCLSPNGVDVYTVDQPPDALLVGTQDGVVRLERDREDRWIERAHTLRETHVSSLMREPTRGRIFAGAHGSGGLYRSDDAGRSWESSMQGIEQRHIFTLGCVTNDAGVDLYAGTEPAHLYRSRDCGETWQELAALREVPGREGWNFPAPPHIAHVKHVTADPRDASRLYVCIEQGALLASRDGGESFEELHFQDQEFKLNRDTHRIVFNPRDPDDIYLDGGDGICRSRDAGRTWERLATPAMRVAYPDHLYYSPEDDGVLFVAGGGTPPNIWRQTGDAQSTIARSDDGGRHWTTVGGGLPARIEGNIEAMTQCVWPGGFGFFAGTTDGEVFASFDRGLTWSTIAVGLPPVSKCVHHLNLAMGRAHVREQAAQTRA